MKQLILGLLLVLSAGCGPTMFPAVQRLNPEEQKQVDQSWNNLLTPANHVDRQTLLDVIIVYQLHQLGVDEFTLTARKQSSAGMVTMRVDFDRARPIDDRLTIAVMNDAGQIIRREVYTSDEVITSAKELMGVEFHGGEVHPIAGPQDDAARLALEKAHDERLERVMAATRPAK